MTQHAVEPARFRQVLGHFPTGVSVITSIHEGQPVGMAIGSFFSVSLEPPLVGFGAARTSSTWPKLRASGRFCVNILAEDQEETCRTFASRSDDKFAGVAYDLSPLGSPRLGGTLAWIDCELDAVHEAGDHDLAIGLVHDLAVGTEGRPLLFFRGGYGV